MTNAPFQARDPYDWPALLALIQSEFAYMEGRIDPPSSMHLLTADSIAAQAKSGEVWVFEDQNIPVACVFLTPQQGALYVGKLAVAQAWRGQGLARLLLQTAETRAHALGLPVLELQTRVELLENHAAFARMGFVKTGETAHPGYAQATSITMQKQVSVHSARNITQ